MPFSTLRLDVLDLAEVAALDLVAHACRGPGSTRGRACRIERGGSCCHRSMRRRLENCQRKSLSNSVTPSLMLSSTICMISRACSTSRCAATASAFAVSSWRSRWRVSVMSPVTPTMRRARPSGSAHHDAVLARPFPGAVRAAIAEFEVEPRGSRRLIERRDHARCAADGHPDGRRRPSAVIGPYSGRPRTSCSDGRRDRPSRFRDWRRRRRHLWLIDSSASA